jgi:hypothetical protein
MADAAARAKHEAPAALMVARPAPRPLGRGEDIRHAFPGADASDNRAGRAGRANGQAVVRVVAVPSPLMPPWRWPAPDA